MGLSHCSQPIAPLSSSSLSLPPCWFIQLHQQDKTTSITHTRDGATTALLSSHIHTTATHTGPNTTADIPCPTQPRHDHDRSSRAGIPMLHKLSVDDMLQLEKLTLIPYSTMRLIRSFLTAHHLPILSSEQRVRRRVAEMIHECEVGTMSMEIDGHEQTITYARATGVLSATTCNSCHPRSNSYNTTTWPPTRYLYRHSQIKEAMLPSCIQSLNRDDVNSVACYEGMLGGVCMYIYVCVCEL